MDMEDKEKSITPEQINKFIEYLDYKSNEWKDDWYMNDMWKARTEAFKEALEVFNGLLEGKEIGELKTDWWKVP